MPATQNTNPRPRIEFELADVTPEMFEAGAAVLKGRFGTSPGAPLENVAADVLLAMFAAMNTPTA
jgi:hypothetical protein